ncbi:MAG: tungstate transport system permease protein [Planctomycetota bacterium]
MQIILDGIREALRLIISRDPAVLDAAFRTAWVSVGAVGISALFGIPFGTALARKRVIGSGLLVLFFRTTMAVPTVFVGITCFLLFSRQGPLGVLELLYTPWAIVFGEVLLAFPIIVSLSHGAVRSLDERVAETARTLGASMWRRWGTYLSEARVGIVLAVLTAFGRCVSELGIAMMVGGNIEGRTRTLSTATALDTNMGNYTRGLAMGLILLFLSLGVTVTVLFLGREGKRK